MPGAEAKIVFDRYHIMTHMGQAVDDVRKREHRLLAATGDTTLTGSKCLWLYAEENLPEQHRERFAQLKATTLKTARAWALKESLRELWHYTRIGWAERHWKRWYFWATHSRLAPVIETARLIQRHLPNVMTFFAHRITNAVAEGLNSKIQTIKKMAYGFRNGEHFKTAIYYPATPRNSRMTLDPRANGAPGHSRGPGHRGQAARARRRDFCRRQPAQAFVEMPFDQSEPSPDRRFGHHPWDTLPETIPLYGTLILRRSLNDPTIL